MQPENPHTLEELSPGRLNPVHEKLLLTGAALGALAYRGYFAERHGETNRLPEPLRDLANSTAHPWVGFTAAGLTLAVGQAIEDRVNNERVKNAIQRKKYAAAVLAGVGANIAVEAIQDAIVHPRHLFTDPASRYESAKDLLAAVIGAGIACAIQSDYGSKIRDRFQAWREQV